jgi:hypothetical protein
VPDARIATHLGVSADDGDARFGHVGGLRGTHATNGIRSSDQRRTLATRVRAGQRRLALGFRAKHKPHSPTSGEGSGVLMPMQVAGAEDQWALVRFLRCGRLEETQQRYECLWFPMRA